MEQPPVVTITTDFGLSDAYVGVMKGVILGICPRATLVDISHDVPPQDIVSGALMLSTMVRYFPPGTVHLAVVDPGVGTTRRPVAIRAEFGTFVGPDNGLFVPALSAAGAVRPESGELTEGTIAVELQEPRFQLHPVSATFHGRDVFAPAAAHLARGVSIDQLGPRLSALTRLQMPEPSIAGDTVRGRVVVIDHFGNAISNVPENMLPASPVVSVKGATVRGLSRTYQDAEIAALVGSNGMLEVGVRNGSAAARFGIQRGDEVVVRAER